MRKNAVLTARSPAGGVMARRARKVLLPAVILILWVWISGERLVRPIFLPSPQDLLAAFWNLRDGLPGAIVYSVSMTIVGFLGGVLAGLSSGLIMAFSRTARLYFGGLLNFLRPVPVFALIPLFVLWFGLGRGPQVALIVFGTSLVVGLTTIEAVKNVPPIFIRAALTLGASRWTIYRTIVVPSILPHIIGAVRAAAAASWGLDVAAEFIGAQTGLGYMIIVRQEYLDSASIILLVVIYSLLAIVMDWGIRRLEGPITRWTERGVSTGAVASIIGAS